MESQEKNQEQALPKRKNKVLITIYQEPAGISKYNMIPQRSSTDHNQTTPTQKQRRTSLGYDRKALLLAYSRHLRKSNTAMMSKPNWMRWKAAFRDHSHGMRSSSSSRGKWRLWFYRTVTGLNRRKWRYYRMNSEDERPVSNVSMHGCFLKARRRLRCIMSRVSCLWRCGKW